jgi:hypothetical protein
VLRGNEVSFTAMVLDAVGDGCTVDILREVDAVGDGFTVYILREVEGPCAWIGIRVTGEGNRVLL